MFTKIIPAITLCVLACSGAAMSQTVESIPSDPERIEFRSQGVPMAGLLYRPAGISAGTTSPIVVVSPPWLNVKEQVATRWAQALADRGIGALAFDFRYWGESGGEPRELESASAKVADLEAAVSYLKSRPDIDPKKIGMLGVCFGAGYALSAAGDDLDIKSVATVAAWLHDKPSLAALFGQEEIDRRYRTARESRTSYEASKQVDYVPAASNTDKTAGMFFPDPQFFYTNPSRGQISQWTNRMAVMSWTEWLDLDGVAAASRVLQPVLVVHSDGSALPENARRAFAAAKGPKDLFWTEGEHTQFYDDPAHIAKAADAVASHFKRTLGGPAANAVASEIEAITSTVNSVAALADARRWADLRNVFADEVAVDYTSLTGGQPSRVKAADLVAGWEKGLSAFTKTEHVVSGHQVKVTGDTAECRARFIATHLRGTDGTDRWTVGGGYLYTLTKQGGVWKITGTTMSMEWEQGKR